MQLELPSRAALATGFVLHKRTLLLVFLFVAALSIRLYRIEEPPLDFHATRQYRSLLIARAFYYEGSSSIPEWRKQVARINQQRQGILEPPVTELLVSAGYRLFGGERYWIPKALSALFWLFGGGFLYVIAKELFDVNAALSSTAVYLFLPFAVTASRSFQPDPLMIMLLLVSVYAILRYDDRPAAGRLIVAAVIAAVTILIKPVSLFVIFSTSLTLYVIRLGLRRSATSRSLGGFFLITLLPTICFYLYGILNTGSLKIQAQASFLPQLLLTIFYWRGWLHNIHLVVGFVAFAGSLLGVMVERPGRSRNFLIGLWAGYVLFCLAFDYHIATHDYYHLQLIPIVAISIGRVFSYGYRRLLVIYPNWSGRAVFWTITTILFIFMAFKAVPHPFDRKLEKKVHVAEAIGEQVNHDVNTIYLSSDYGLSLEYHGELSGEPWPLASDLEWERLAGETGLDADERFQAWFAPSAPHYFIVLDLHEYEKQADLKKFLSGRYPIFVRDDDYLIFDLRQKQSSQ